MGMDDIKQRVCGLNTQHKNILVGFNDSDDACVYKINEEEALVQTLNFITPVVDDSYLYGKIAANALSDVFSMGGEVKTALNIVGFDQKNLEKHVLDEILKGGNEKIKECGGVLIGGHTIESSEMFYGLSLTGMVHPKIYKNNTAKIGHVLVLTKPLGMGILSSAIKKDLLEDKTINETVKIMESLNYLPSQIMKKYDVSACTNIGNLGLLGHALKSTNPFTSYTIHCGEVPVAPLAQELVDQGVVPEETLKNMKYIDAFLTIMCNTEKCKLMYCDVQTSGGLLIAMKKEDAQEFVKEIEEITFGYAKIIGEVIPRGISPLIVY